MKRIKFNKMGSVLKKIKQCSKPSKALGSPQRISMGSVKDIFSRRSNHLSLVADDMFDEEEE